MAVKPLVGAQLVRGHPLAQGLIAAWLFNEGAGSTVWDYSGNLRTASGSGDSWTAGPSGWVRSFSYNRLGGIAAGVAPWYTPPITVIARARTNNASNTHQHLAYDSRGDGGIGLGFGKDFNDMSFSVQAVHDVHGGSDPFDGEWHSIAGVITPEHYLRLYEEGVLVARADTVSTPAYQTDTLSIGYIDGDLDYVLYYNRALSASEIAQVTADPYCMFTRPDRWLRVFDFGGITRYPAAHRTHVWRNGPITYIGGT